MLTWHRYREILSYSVIGLVTTSTSYLIMFALIYVGISAYVSNFIGYVFGLIITFLGNKKLTFKVEGDGYRQVRRFLTSFVVSYLTNYSALYLFVEVLQYNPYLSQILAGPFYVITMFVLMRAYVFKNY